MLRPQKDIFTTGEISKAKNNLPWRYLAEESGGGLIMDVGCHTLDIIDYMVGEVFNVNGLATRLDGSKYFYDVEDQVTLSGKFENNAILSCSWSFSGTPNVYDDTIIIRGSKGELKLSTFQPTPLILTLIDKKDDPVVMDLPPPKHAQLPLIQLICNYLLDKKGSTNPSSGVNSIRIANYIDTSLSSYYGKTRKSSAFWENKSLWPGISDKN